MRIILASGSPRRKQLLKERGIDFEIIKALGEENTTKTDPEEIVKELSFNKAKEVFDAVNSDDEYLVIGSDTIVFFQGEVLGKPKDRVDAKRMISMLSGNVHQVYTGVTLVKSSQSEPYIISFADKTDVYVKQLSESEIDEYVASGDCDDKAGSYGIQGEFGRYIDHIVGDLNNVIGLPADHVIEELNKLM